MNIPALVLYILGLIIIIGSHVWLLIKGSLPQNDVVGHAIANLVAAGFIIIGYMLLTKNK